MAREDSEPGSGGHSAPRVVVGVDGSEASSAALVWAAEEARLRGCTLEVVNAWGLPSLSYTAYLPPDAFEDAAATAAAGLEEQIVKVLGTVPGVAVVRTVREGPPTRVILDAARGADLVVVGSRGRGGFSGLLLGSVSAQVAHYAQCPVAIVRSPAPAAT